MNVLWIIFVSSFVNISVSDDLEWNYPYYNLNKFLSYLVPHIWEGEQHFNSDGSYLFRYDTGHVHQSFRGEIRDSKGVIQGYYGYVDPNGVLRITEYISDNLGYRAKTTRWLLETAFYSRNTENWKNKTSGPYKRTLVYYLQLIQFQTSRIHNHENLLEHKYGILSPYVQFQAFKRCRHIWLVLSKTETRRTI